MPETAKPDAGSTRPKTGVPPWEITDSFLAVPPAGASANLDRGAPTPDQPSNPTGVSMEGGGPADSTESFPTVDSGADQRSSPGANPGDSTETFPAVRLRADLEDAFRLFPPVRGTDNRPSTDGQN
jgi:hypothetical protein